jgi:hypothetical protein
VTAQRASFVLRLSRDVADRAWHGVIELVGGDRRTAVSNATEIGEFIERSLDAVGDEEDRDA